MTDDDRALVQQAKEMADRILGVIAMDAGRETVDARVVATACASVAGSYVFNITDAQLKREFVEHWCATFRKYAGAEKH